MNKQKQMRREVFFLNISTENRRSICYFRLNKQSCMRTNKVVTIYTHKFKHLLDIDTGQRGWMDMIFLDNRKT